MNEKEDICSFLHSNGFIIVQKKNSLFFGDTSIVLSNGFFEFRVTTCRSFESVEIRINILNEKWYDLALVRALLYDEKNLIDVIGMKGYNIFLQKEFSNISELFIYENYLSTKQRLDELVHKRVLQMFPSLGGS